MSKGERDEFVGTMFEADEYELNPSNSFPRRTDIIRRSMIPKDSLDEYVVIDITCPAHSMTLFEYIADAGFRIERLFFDEPIRYVTVRMGVRRFGNEVAEYTKDIPLSWFCGIGKDGMLGQPVTRFKAFMSGEHFNLQIENQGSSLVRVLGVLAGKLLADRQ